MYDSLNMKCVPLQSPPTTEEQAEYVKSSTCTKKTKNQTNQNKKTAKNKQTKNPAHVV